MTRNTHDRLHDHFGDDLDSNMLLDGATATYSGGSDLHEVLDDMDTRIVWATASGGAAYLNDLLDVTAPTPVSGQFLSWDGDEWVPTTISGGFTDPMTSRGDIIIRNPSNVTARLGIGASGTVLKSDGTDINWGTVSGGSGATYLDDLVDVNAPSPASGQALVWDGSEWAPATISGGTASDVVQVASGVGSVVIPGLAASPDIRVAGTNDDEFDTTDTSDPMTGWTTLGSPTTHNINSTALSHYYVKRAANAATHWAGIYKASPSTPFTVSAKLTASSLSGNYAAASLFVGEATPGKMDCLEAAYDGGSYQAQLEYFTSPTAYSSTPWGGAVNGSGISPVYLRIVVTSSTNIAYYWSRDGLLWHAGTTGRNPGFTVGSVGLAVKSENASFDAEALFDWVRFS